MLYLDNAATSFPKPRPVLAAMRDCARACGNPGRGGHSLAMRAAETVYACREVLAEQFGSGHPENVIFTMNATMALNFAIKGLACAGDHILISDLEHNAVRRPVAALAAAGTVRWDVFPSFAGQPDRSDEAILDGIRRAVRPETRLLVCTHASNICSVTMPIEKIGAFCRERHIRFVVDAAQSAGHLPVDMRRMAIDVLCAPGHKGLLGGQGSGFLILREGLRLRTLLEGGSGVDSVPPHMPDEAPERYEAGTLPVPAIAGICAGVRYLRELGPDTVRARESAWNARLRERLLSLPGVEVLVPEADGAILLFRCRGVPSERIGAELNRRGICVRAGLHCAPLAHGTLGTLPDGAVRVSPGIFTRPADADVFWRALREVLL